MNPGRTLWLGILPMGLLFSGCIVNVLDDDFVDSDRVEARESFVIEQPVEQQSVVRLVAINGSIEVRTSATADEVRITGERIVGSESRADANARLDDLSVDVRSTANEIFIETNQPRNANGRRYEVHYRLLVPEGFDTDIDQANGAVNIAGILRDVEVDNINGSVVVDDRAVVVLATVINGNVDVDLAELQGRVELMTTNGNVTLGMPATSSARLTAQLVNGSISLSGLTLENPVVTPRRVTGTLSGGTYVVDLATVNGNIRISAN